MVESEELQALLALQEFSGIGSILGQRLVAHFGSAQAVFAADPKQLAEVHGVGFPLARALSGYKELHRFKKILLDVQSKGYEVLPVSSNRYPEGLRHIPDAPLVMFYEGLAEAFTKRMVGIVGTRHATPYGLEQTRALVKGLASAGVTVVSGLAYGIDAAAHEAALKDGLPTVAVVAHGLNHVYPPDHVGLAHRIKANGGLLTEHLPFVGPERAHFPMRNRLIAGLCDVLVVVESGKRGGAMITAKLARDYHREVFAIPGKITDPMSQGCLELISGSWAALLADPSALAESMGWHTVGKQTDLFTALSGEEGAIVSFLKQHGPTSIEALAETLQKPLSHVSARITHLELEGWVVRRPGGTLSLA
jgi:DNA processing protein